MGEPSIRWVELSRQLNRCAKRSRTERKRPPLLKFELGAFPDERHSPTFPRLFHFSSVRFIQAPRVWLLPSSVHLSTPSQVRCCKKAHGCGRLEMFQNSRGALGNLLPGPASSPSPVHRVPAISGCLRHNHCVTTEICCAPVHKYALPLRGKDFWARGGDVPLAGDTKWGAGGRGDFRVSIKSGRFANACSEMRIPRDTSDDYLCTGAVDNGDPGPPVSLTNDNQPNTSRP